MADSVFGIDKGIIKAFGLMVVIIGSLTTFFLSEYVSAILLGSVFYTSNNGTTTTDVTAQAFIPYNLSTVVYTSLGATQIVENSLVIYNATNAINVNNFTVLYEAGNITLNETVGDPQYNGTSLLANYTYYRVSSLPITSDTQTLVSNAEDDYVTTFTYINTGVKFAAALITVVAVILVFAAFLPKNRGKKEMDY